MKVAVVGGGVMGCAAALALARAGQQVEVLERFEIGNRFGSSHGASRIIRLSYSDPRYTALARRAFQLWKRLEQEQQVGLQFVTGGVDFGMADSRSLSATRLAMQAAGVEHETWTPEEFSRHYPQFKPHDDGQVLYQKDTAVLRAGECLLALRRQAEILGAVFSEGEDVRDIGPCGDGVRMQTNLRSLTADRVVVTTGAQIERFMSGLRCPVPLTVSKEQASYLRVRDSARFQPGRFPVAIRHFTSPIFSSIFPIIEAEGIKMMIEKKRQLEDPHDYEVDFDNERQVVRDASLLLEGITGEVIKTETCRYTLTRDEDFIIDRHPDFPQVVLTSACSGHGFKFAPLVGEMAAGFALDHQSDPDAGMFSLARPTLSESFVA